MHMKEFQLSVNTDAYYFRVLDATVRKTKWESYGSKAKQVQSRNHRLSAIVGVPGVGAAQRLHNFPSAAPPPLSFCLFLVIII